MSQGNQTATAEATILIVDDEPAVCQLLAESFANRPWRVEQVHSAGDALALCARTAVDVVILDKNLPDMSGVKLFWQLRSEGHKLACVMITGYASAESAVEMLNLGVSAYLEKPFEDLFAVGETVAEVLRQQRACTARAARLHRARHPDRAAARKHALTVLLASPDAGVRRGAQTSLAGDTIVEAATMPALEEALAAAERFQLIVLHAALSPTTCSALAAAVRTRAPSAPLVVIARRPPVTILKQLIELEVDVLVEEPFNAGSFASAVASLVAHLRQERAPGRGGGGGVG